MIQQLNLFSGEKYMLEDRSIVTYNGFRPADGHCVIAADGREIWLPHRTKFYQE